MPDTPLPLSLRPRQTYGWWLVLALIGLDYFSTLAYLPSIALDAVRYVHQPRELAPLAALGVVLVTLFGALPVYWYVVGRSPDGSGATGLLDRRLHGWLAKVLILVLLGFVATDLVITRSLSVSDAATHILNNPEWQERAEWSRHHREELRASLPALLRGRFFDYWDEQLVVTVLLSVAGFAFWALQGGFRRWFVRLAAAVVVVYLSLNAVLLVGALATAAERPQLWRDWWAVVRPPQAGGGFWELVAVTLLTFPQVALGLSGFELTMGSVPLVRGGPNDDAEDVPQARVARTRRLMVTAALVMTAFLPPAVLAVTLLVPDAALEERPALARTRPDPERPEYGAAQHRALAYLAHGLPLRGPAAGAAVLPLCGPAFGTLYDLSTVLILCLAGASVTLGLRDVVPRYLARFGMELRWASRVGLTLHLFNGVILLVTVVFRASVSAQQWAYATSVLVLVTGASVAALVDAAARWGGSTWSLPLTAPFGLLAAFFLAMAGLTMWLNAAGLAIALAFLAVLFGSALLSRWLRNKELRFEGFTFADDKSRQRWEEIRELEFQVLVPHRPGHHTLAETEAQVRQQHRLAADVPIIFVEVSVGDPSAFLHRPLLQVAHENGREVLRVTQCASVAHVLAALALEFTHTGRPPELYFGWAEESPLAASLGFLFLGRGNVPWLVHELIVHNQADPLRRPRVVVG